MSHNREPEQENTGDKIKKVDFEICELQKLLSLLIGEGAKNIYGVGKDVKSAFEKTLTDSLKMLKDNRESIVKTDPAPEKITCPHCEYDGEFDVEKPEHDGFRALQPVLEPRLVLSYDGATLSMSDTDDSHDPFDMISDPSHHHFMDGPDANSPDYMEMRKLVRGNWLLCCGKCFEYFSMKDFLGKVNLDYPGESAWNSKWREAK